jgi:DNA-binding MarR family transcriptional regulator
MAARRRSTKDKRYEDAARAEKAEKKEKTAEGAVRWLSPAEQETWRAFLAATRLLFEELERRLQQEAGIPVTYYEILVALSEAPDRTIRMHDLAELTRSSPSRLSHAVSRLEEAGWVERVSCATDRRGAFAHLTDKGFVVLAAAAPGHATAVRRYVFDRITPEQSDELGQILGVIRDGLDADGRCPGARREPGSEEGSGT